MGFVHSMPGLPGRFPAAGKVHVRHRITRRRVCLGFAFGKETQQLRRAGRGALRTPDYSGDLLPWESATPRVGPYDPLGSYFDSRLGRDPFARHTVERGVRFSERSSNLVPSIVWGSSVPRLAGVNTDSSRRQRRSTTKSFGKPWPR